LPGVSDGAPEPVPPRRRASWSLKSIVEDVAGKPIGDFQEPGKPVHPYLKVKLDAAASERRPSAAAPDEPEPYDPVGHLYPPLVGAHGREYHGPEHEHHAETLERHPAVPAGVGERPRSAGPLHRPERLYLHYLLLHLDRLSDSALAYLRTAVEEEVAHRARPFPVSGKPEPAPEVGTDPAVAAPPLPMPAR
jgi:hypothetical protein